MLKIAVTKGRIEKEVYKLLKEAGFDVEPIENKERKLSIKTRDNIEIVYAKAIDVLNFTEKGVVDIGIVGKDTLEESEYDNYIELLDLNVGKCYFALAGYPEYKDNSEKKVIATKYPNIATKYFNNKNQDIEIVKMEGSVELGPVIGMTDAIVDIVETGSTLKANGLVVLDKICNISTRLIANNNSLKNKSTEIDKIVDRFSQQINVKEGF